MDFIYLLLIVFIFLFLLWLLAIYMANQNIVRVLERRNHFWKKNEDGSFRRYCVVCELMHQSGFICECCDVACDKEECLKIINKVSTKVYQK
jgi:hypothetical protein